MLRARRQAADRGQDTGRLSPDRRILLAAALASLAVGVWACWSVTVDDAYITYRYSANLAHGFGPVWNPGRTPVEGFTNFAWMVWHAPWVWLGVPLPVVSKLTAAACAAALATSDPPRKVSKQCFHIFPRIREIDALLRAAPAWRDRIV